MTSHMIVHGDVIYLLAGTMDNTLLLAVRVHGVCEQGDEKQKR